MKILLDENISLRIKVDFGNHHVESVKSMRWLGTKNGELLKLINKNKFDVLISLDSNLQYQQKLETISLIFIIIKCKNNRDETVEPLLRKASQLLKVKLKRGVYQIS